MDAVNEWFRTTLGLSPEFQSKIITSIIIAVALWLINAIINALFLRRVKDLRLRYNLRKTFGYILFFTGAIAIVRVWFGDFQQATTYLGLLSAGIAIALRDPIVNLAGWVFIALRRPFAVGDRIQIGQHSGDVIDLRVFQFTILEIGNWVAADQSTGRIIHIPNGKIFSEPLANYGKGFDYIWNEIPVLITFESDWKKAKDILQHIATKHSESLSEAATQKVTTSAQKFMIFYSVLTPTVYTSVKESGVLLTIRHLCEPRRRRTKSEAIWEDILEQFGNENDIDFAYPTRRFYDNAREGKAHGGDQTCQNS
ncbi:mechanosensitive ion channel family protein [Candidatus Eisenbacteria bacterium]|uniref:Mechanosensitive ion channel family protein n=1 Tax=Eiseniibacteriota bacterium TaxID=2212470 RepID=A0ABV6YNM7_UNCEI